MICFSENSIKQKTTPWNGADIANMILRHSTGPRLVTRLTVYRALDILNYRFFDFKIALNDCLLEGIIFKSKARFSVDFEIDSDGCLLESSKSILKE